MKKIRLAILNSNHTKIGPFTKKGTEIFSYILINNLLKYYQHSVQISAFCSGNSQIPVKKISIAYRSSTENQYINNSTYFFELALISKALSMQKAFDIFHVNIMNGELILPFVQFVKKPIVITMHGNTNEKLHSLFFSLFNHLPHVYFTPISNYQKKFLPSLNYTKTIYHGINSNIFSFNALGGKQMIWTGRAIPEKGLDVVLQVAKKMKKQTKVFPIIKNEYLDWLQNEVLKKREIINQIVRINFDFNVTRSNLVKEYQSSKLFLFPLKWEEPFGLTLIESMSCGTPIVAFARGSVPEIVKDGETGFIVNPSDDDIRGNWIIKKACIEGLCEAVERIYAMPEDQYRQMRQNCRSLVEKNFTVEHMVNQYVDVYKEVLTKK